MPLYGSAYLNRAKAESQTAGHPVQWDEFGMTLPVKTPPNFSIVLIPEISILVKITTRYLP